MDEKTYLQALMSYQMALSRSEILKLLKEDVDLTREEINLKSSSTRTKQTSRPSIEIDENILPLLKKYCQASTGIYVFPSESNPRRPQQDNRYYWSKARKESGIHCRFEDLRYSAIQNLKLRGMSDSTASREFDALKRNQQEQIRARPGTVSNILWHFTGGPYWSAELRGQDKRPKSEDDAYQRLISIVESHTLKLGSYREKIELRVPDENPKKRTQQFKTLEIPTSRVCCLADIPIMHLRYHAARYGKFALGFRRTAAIEAGFNPVFYTPEQSNALLGLQNALLRTNPDATEEKNGADALAFVKTFTPDQFETIYTEREWRSLRDFDFKYEELAFVVLPRRRGYYEAFIKWLRSKRLSLDSFPPVVSWEDLLEH